MFLRILIHLCFLGGTLHHLGAEEQRWDDSDSRNANRYIALLNQTPEDGAIVEILWKLYEKHEATDLLVSQYTKFAAGTEDSAPLIVLGHLQRKQGDIEKAATSYEEALRRSPQNRYALYARADLAAFSENISLAIDYFKTLIEQLPEGDELMLPILQRLGSLYLEIQEQEEALASWKQALALKAGDFAFGKEICDRLANVGMLEEAVEFAQDLVETVPQEDRVRALREMARLQEFRDDFAGASKSLRLAMDLVHYRHWVHDEIFLKSFHLHERFAELAALESSLKLEASLDNATEEALYLMSQFYHHTADLREEQVWLELLVSHFPNTVAYGVQLANVLMANDELERAAKLLDALLDKGVSLNLVLKRASVDLKSGNKEEAQGRLQRMLKYGVSKKGRREILTYSLKSYLDDVAEQLLLEEADSDPDSNDKMQAVVDFYFERSREKDGELALFEFANRKKDEIIEFSQRLLTIGEILRQNGYLESAERAAIEGLETETFELEHLLALGDVYALQSKVEEAIRKYEEGWKRSSSTSDRVDVDERILALFQQIASKRSKDERRQEQLQRRILSNQFDGDLSRLDSSPIPQETLEYYEHLEKTLASAEEPVSIKEQWRLAWWAYRIGDHVGALDILLPLSQMDPPDVETIRLLVNVAMQSENVELASRELERLAELEPDRAPEHLRRKAEIEMKLGKTGDAIRTVEKLIPFDPDNIALRETLAKAYLKRNQVDQAIAMWREAYDRTSDHDVRRRIVEHLSKLLRSQRRYDEILDLQTDVIAGEPDAKKRREMLQAQLVQSRSSGHLDALRITFEALVKKHPLDAFYLESLARIYQMMGKEAKAFEWMRRAYYISSERDSLIHAVREMAMESGELSSAIYYQRQFVALPDHREKVGEWKKLIELQERDLDVTEADVTRARMERNFGGDTEVLSNLASDYFKQNRIDAAIRVLRQLVQLRSWDLDARLRLGILLSKKGEVDEALISLRGILTETPTEHAKGDLLPMREFVFEEKGSGFEMVRYISRSNPLSTSDLRAIEHFFSLSRPELAKVPKEKAYFRLRAIEEAGKVVDRMGESIIELWPELFVDASDAELLWAAYYGGDPAKAYQILESKLGKDTSETRIFLHCLQAFYLGQTDALLLWMATQDDVSREKQKMLLVALDVCLSDNRIEVPFASLKNLVTSATFSPNRNWSLVFKLDQLGRYAESLELASQMPLGIRGRYVVARRLAAIAKKAQMAKEQRYYLEVALEEIDDVDEFGFKNHLVVAISEMWAILDPLEKVDFQLKWENQLDELPERRDCYYLRARVHQVLGNEERASLAGKQFISSEIERTSGLGAGEAEDVVATCWQNIRNFCLIFVGEGDLEMANAFMLYADQLGECVDAPGDARVSFNISYVVWKLRGKSFPEREAIVRRNLYRFEDFAGLMVFANQLIEAGYLREAITVCITGFERGAPSESATEQNYLVRASRESKQFEPLLEMLAEAIKGSEKTFGDRQHTEALLAEFLRVSQNEEELIRLANDWKRRHDDIAILEFTMISVYERELMQLYRDRGDAQKEEQLIRGLLTKGRSLVFSDLVLRLARLQMKDGKPGAAEATLNKVRASMSLSRDTEFQMNRLLLLGEIYTEAGSVEQLEALIPEALEQTGTNVRVEFANHLVDAGLTEKAMSLLKLTSRETAPLLQRLDVLVDLAEVQFEFDRREACEETLTQLIGDVEVREHIEGMFRALSKRKDAVEWTPYFRSLRRSEVHIARQAAMAEVAIWLGNQLDEEALKQLFSRMESLKPSLTEWVSLSRVADEVNPRIGETLWQMTKAAFPRRWYFEKAYLSSGDPVVQKPRLEEAAQFALSGHHSSSPVLWKTLPGLVREVNSVLSLDLYRKFSKFISHQSIDYASQKLIDPQAAENFYREMLELLLDKGRFREAESMLMEMYATSSIRSVDVLVEFLQRTDRADELETFCERFGLSEGWRMIARHKIKNVKDSS